MYISVSGVFQSRSFILDDPLGLTAASDYDLAVSALGACLWYLQRCFIEKDLLSIKSFEVSVLCCVSFTACLVYFSLDLQTPRLSEWGSVNCSFICRPVHGKTGGWSLRM